MTGISRLEQMILALGLGFLLVAGGTFVVQELLAPPYEVAIRQETGGVTRPTVINLNRAGVYELQLLPGIGEKRAQDIVDYRETHGPFRSVDELTNVKGIGQATVEKLREYVTI